MGVTKVIQVGLPTGSWRDFWRDFQNVGNRLAGTAGWRWTRWISHRILRYVTVCLASLTPEMIGCYIPNHFPWFGAGWWLVREAGKETDGSGKVEWEGRGLEERAPWGDIQSGIEKYCVFFVFVSFKI